MRKAIYTVITGEYDTLKKPSFVSDGFDYICFTDDSTLESDFWQIRQLGESGCMKQREVKVLAHKYLPEYDLTVYVDGSHELTGDVNELIAQMKTNWILKKHPSRINVYQEGLRIIQLKKDSANKVNKQLLEYKRASFRKNILFETGFMVRKNAEDVSSVCEKWFNQLSKHSHRDQLSLPFVIGDCKHEALPSRIINSYFTIHKHDGFKLIPTIHYLTPGRADKDIGKAYNDACSLIPNGDWICIRDQDSLFWPETALKQIETIVKAYGKTYSLFGAMTNRLNSEGQRPYPEDFDNLDILHHKKIADELAIENWGKIKEYNKPIAGLFMVFPKILWNEVKFTEKSINADTLFCREIIKKRKKIALMTGVYTYHFYRADKENPRTYKKHLIA